MHRIAPSGEPDPVFFLGYFKNPEGTAKKFTGDWCRTGDLARRDEDGYLWYQGRADDMFKAAGYRIGPSEIENCLVRHPAVANAAVVPSPDEVRGNVVKAFIVLAAGEVPSAAIEDDIRQHVRRYLAPYEYPKEIEFIDALPMTTTGKVQRRVLRERERAEEGGGHGNGLTGRRRARPSARGLSAAPARASGARGTRGASAPTRRPARRSAGSARRTGTRTRSPRAATRRIPSATRSAAPS